MGRGILDVLKDEHVERLKEKWFGVYRGIVRDVNDPDTHGRVKVEVHEVLGPENLSEWASYCAPFGGGGAGFFMLPDVGDGVWVMFEKGDTTKPVWLGYWYNDEDAKPTDGDKKVRVIVSKEGLKIVFDDTSKEIVIDADTIKVGEGATRGAARLDDSTKTTSAEDAAFWAMWTAFFAVITGAPIPEPGSGSPSALQTALALAISGAGGTPSSITGKIITASDKVKEE